MGLTVVMVVPLSLLFAAFPIEVRPLVVAPPRHVRARCARPCDAVVRRKPKLCRRATIAQNTCKIGKQSGRRQPFHVTKRARAPNRTYVSTIRFTSGDSKQPNTEIMAMKHRFLFLFATLICASS